MSVTDLSTELLLEVASYLSQLDILNVSLTCKRLHNATAPQLFREYRNVQRDGHQSPLPFIKHILTHPRLASHVHYVQLKAWSTLASLDPRHWMIESDDWTGKDDLDEKKYYYTPKSDAEDHNRYKELFGEDYVESNEEDAWEPTEEFVRDEYDPSIQHQLEPSLAEYNLMVSAAKAAGIISDINTYEDAETQHRNTIRHKLSDAHFRKCTLEDQSATWDTFLSTFSHDDRFRLGLRLGIEDPLIMLLFAILPCLREIYFYAVPFEKSALTLKAPRHRFATVKKITSFSGPITYFNALLLGTSSGSIELSNTRSWKYRTHMMKDTTPLSLPPRSCNIARLAFESCDFTRQDMKTLIEACQGLKVFRSKIHGRFIEVVCDETSISFKEQLDLLFPLQIEELSLDAFTGGSILNTLPRSTSLVTLNIDSNQAFNRMRGRPGHTFWREIPSSLKHLILSACSESTSTPFDKLLPQMPDTLQQISLVVQDDHFAEVLQAKLTDKLQKPHVPYTVYTRDQFALEQVRSQPNAVAHRPPMSLYELWPDNQSVDFNPLRDAWKYHVRWNGIKYLNYL